MFCAQTAENSIRFVGVFLSTEEKYNSIKRQSSQSTLNEIRSFEALEDKLRERL
jgi:hypothetical protein